MRANTYLSELAQRGKLGQRRQLDVGHAKKLKFFERVIQAFDFPVAGPAVIEHQLRHLQTGYRVTRQLEERRSAAHRAQTATREPQLGPQKPAGEEQPRCLSTWASASGVEGGKNVPPTRFLPSIRAGAVAAFTPEQPTSSLPTSTRLFVRFESLKAFGFVRDPKPPGSGLF